ncbi:hypothetical protein ACNHG4_20590, partial [Bacillus paralicheniformis]
IFDKADDIAVFDHNELTMFQNSNDPLEILFRYSPFQELSTDVFYLQKFAGGISDAGITPNGEDTINEQAKWLHHIKSETERMKTLTNDLLYLTELDDTGSRTEFSWMRRSMNLYNMG